MKQNRKHPHGLAAMLVLIVVALATLLSMAMLSSASLQASVSDSAVRGAAADYMVSSALQTAAHYLQYTSKVPATWTRTGYTFYVAGASMSGVSGKFDVNAAPITGFPDSYLVTATGYDFSGAVTRSATAKVQLQRAMPAYSAVFGTGIYTIPSNKYTFNGSILLNGILMNLLGGTITGSVTSPPKTTDFSVPTTSTIYHYGAGASPTSYTLIDGTTGTAQVLPANVTSATSFVASATNPGKIFYCNGPLTIKPTTSIAISGTVIVLGSANALTLQTTSVSAQTITITPVSGLPAVIADGGITFNSKNMGLTTNGVVWSGGAINWSVGTPNSSLLVNGSLLLATGASMGAPNGPTTITINFDSSKNTVNFINTTAEPITGVKYTSWTQ